MRINVVKQRLKKGIPMFGAEAGMGSSLIAEAFAYAGFDFVQVDNQHGLWSHKDLLNAFRGICLGGALPMCRIQNNNYAEIGTIMDLGALGIVVPMVNSAEEAVKVVRAAFYPPYGDRSNGAIGVGIHGTQAEYLEYLRDEALIIVQIETREAVEQAEEILGVDGIDGCMIGPNDLGLSMGVSHWSAEHEAAIEETLQVCRKVGKIPGIAAWGREANSPERRAGQGFLFIQSTGDREIIPKGSAEILASVKAFREQGTE